MVRSKLPGLDRLLMTHAAIGSNSDGANINSEVKRESIMARRHQRLGFQETTMRESIDRRIGAVLDGRYRIVKRLAQGGSGVVYLAQRIGLDRAVAIKFLELSAAKQKTFLTLFEREARAMGQLFHPNCVSVTDFGVADVPYIVMDLVDGYTLRQLIDRGPVEPFRAVFILSQLLAALAHAHKKGIIHRDIKPGNIMLSEVTGTGEYVRVFDFGMAKLLDVDHGDEDDPDLVAGTPHYMSPEHINNKELDARSDLFSAGIVLYELLTGKKPFIVNRPSDILMMHDNEPLPINRVLAGGRFSNELEAVVTRSLAIDISERFQHAIEFRDALLSVPEAGPSIQHAGLRGLRPQEDIAPIDSSNRFPRSFGIKGSTILWASIAALSALLALDIYMWLKIQPHSTDGIKVSPIDDLDQPKPLERMHRHLSAPTAEPDEKPAPEHILAQRDLSPHKETLSEATASPVKAGGSQPLDRSRPTELKLILAQIKAGNREAAIVNLIELKDKHPYNAYLYLLLGNLLSEQRQWSEAIRAYRSAVALDPSYRSHNLLIGNAVLAIKDDLAYPEAKELIEREIGPAAIEKLLPLTQPRGLRRLQERAQELIDRLSSNQ
ncbi:MAG: serine/threonine protein kinase [Deltaproteobacteria bacterium]|nr:serine/threonine protein kinase [Deltaproteobacteria bacterium]